MTAKEKATELYNKYKNTLNIQNDMRPGANPFAKACALIVVETVIHEIADVQLHYGVNLYDDLSYWDDVKKDLEAL